MSGHRFYLVRLHLSCLDGIGFDATRTVVALDPDEACGVAVELVRSAYWHVNIAAPLSIAVVGCRALPGEVTR